MRESGKGYEILNKGMRDSLIYVATDEDLPIQMREEAWRECEEFFKPQTRKASGRAA